MLGEQDQHDRVAAPAPFLEGRQQLLVVGHPPAALLLQRLHRLDDGRDAALEPGIAKLEARGLQLDRDQHFPQRVERERPARFEALDLRLPAFVIRERALGACIHADEESQQQQPRDRGGSGRHAGSVASPRAAAASLI